MKALTINEGKCANCKTIVPNIKKAVSMTRIVDENNIIMLYYCSEECCNSHSYLVGGYLTPYQQKEGNKQRENDD